MERTHALSHEACLAAVSAALTDVVTQDQTLLELDAHELSLVHRFAVYLENHLQPELHQLELSIDLDYDRHGYSPKWLPPRWDKDEGRRFRPDLIVHHRKDDSKNLLVVEWRKRANDKEINELQERLRSLLIAGNKPAAYNYELGALVNSSDEGILWRAYDHNYRSFYDDWQLVTSA